MTKSDSIKLLSYLYSLNKEQLVDQIFELIKNNPEQLKSWLAKAGSGDVAMNTKELRKSITAGIPINKHIFESVKVRKYFYNVDKLVNLLRGELIGAYPDQELKLVDYFYQRLWRALETVDDSLGLRLGLLEHIGNLHKFLFSAWEAPLSAKVAYLRSLERQNYSDLLPPLPYFYMDTLSEKGLECLTESYQQDWDALPNLNPNSKWEVRVKYLRCQEYLVKQAEKNQDLQKIVQLKMKTATDVGDFEQIVSICIVWKDWDQAQLWLARARKYAEKEKDTLHTGLDELELEIALAKQNWPKAVDAQWRIYCSTGAINDLRQLQHYADQCGDQRDFKNQAESYFLNQISLERRTFRTWIYLEGLLNLYVEMELFEKAAALNLQYRLTPDLKLKLARALKSSPNTVIPIFFDLADAEILKGNRQAYMDAVRLLQECYQMLGSPAHEFAFNERLADLKLEHKAKRVLQELLNNHLLKKPSSG